MGGIDRRRAAGWAGLAWVLFLVAAPGAAARETREIAGGRFQLTVGFLNEPAFEGEPNGLYLRIGERVSAEEVDPPVVPRAAASPRVAPRGDATPVAPTPTPRPGSALTAEVAFGGDVMPLKLEPAAQPGTYQAVFVPTQPGDYVFRVRGTLAGWEIAEDFRTGGEDIPSVVGVSGLQFPQEVPVGQGLLDALEEREAAAERARTLAVVGVLLGVVGLLAGGIAVVLSRRPPPDERRDA